MAATNQALDSERSQVMAAVDLGSNSFHMVVAHLHHGQLAIIDRLKEMVRLAAGLGPDGTLSDESQDRALECLGRFGERIRDMHADRVRVVGTNTLRKAGAPEKFLARAEEALGHPVDVISGIEEARLIYSGVAHNSQGGSGRRFVVDIGGGSTELIIGAGLDSRYLESLALGCVRMTQVFFADGKFDAENFSKARLAIRLGLSPIAAAYRRVGWETAIGTSGTIRAAQRIANELGLADGTLTPAAIEAIIEKMIAAKRLDKLSLPGLSERRAPVFAGGIAILAGVLSSLEIDELTVSDGALREGLIYEMLGTSEHEDARERTVEAVAGRFHVDPIQAERVESTVLRLFDAVEASWSLTDARYRSLLSWAARLHEIGLDISHSHHHQHGGYLLENADLPGFVLMEQQMLAALVRYQRRKLDGMSLDHLQTHRREPVFRLIVLLRLAVLLNRTRSPVEIPDIELHPKPKGLVLRFPSQWFADNPLTEASIVEEQAWLESVGFKLQIDNHSNDFAP